MYKLNNDILLSALGALSRATALTCIRRMIGDMHAPYQQWMIAGALGELLRTPAFKAGVLPHYLDGLQVITYAHTSHIQYGHIQNTHIHARKHTSYQHLIYFTHKCIRNRTQARIPIVKKNALLIVVLFVCFLLVLQAAGGDMVPQICSPVHSTLQLLMRAEPTCENLSVLFSTLSVKWYECFSIC